MSRQDVEEDEEFAAECEAPGSDEEDDRGVDVSQEGVNEDYMWRLAEDPTFGPHQSRHLCFVESAIALPPSAVCVECEKEGKVFSKSQLARHPDERRCQECVQKTLATIYGPTVVAAGTKCTAMPAIPVETRPGTQVALCCVCKVQLSNTNCSRSQKQKTPSRRKCNDCVSAA